MDEKKIEPKDPQQPEQKSKQGLLARLRRSVSRKNGMFSDRALKGDIVDIVW